MPAKGFDELMTEWHFPKHRKEALAITCATETDRDKLVLMVAMPEYIVFYFETSDPEILHYSNIQNLGFDGGALTIRAKNHRKSEGCWRLSQPTPFGPIVREKYSRVREVEAQEELAKALATVEKARLNPYLSEGTEDYVARCIHSSIHEETR